MKTIERVRLSELKPNESNPRSDFGDIEALADSISATGGEPVNPIVCVRDANALFIVDGERRYRALKAINKEEDPEISVTVVDGWGEAAEVLAMLATDNKMRLSDAELSKGYQLAFDLGTDYINDTQLSMSTGAETGKVSAARMVWEDLGKPQREKYAQLSLDQLAAAQEFEGREREAVLGAKPEGWRMKARSLREKRARAELDAKVADLCARLGIEWIDAKGYEVPPELEECRTIWSMDDSKLAELEVAIAERGASALLRSDRGWDGMYKLLRPASEDGARESAEARRLRLDRERAEAAAEASKRRLTAFFADAPKSRKALRLAAAEHGRKGYYLSSFHEMLEEAGADQDTVAGLLAEPASAFELIRWIDCGMTGFFPTALAAARADGYELTEDEEWLLGYIEGRRDGDGGE